VTEQIRKMLFSLADEKYRDFQCRIISTVSPETVLGIRTPDLRRYAQMLIKENDTDNFLNSLPHLYFEENQLHAFIISELKNYDECIGRVNVFLPYIDNWATCDQLSPKVFGKNRIRLYEEIKNWIASEKTYTIRFGIGMLMQHFLDDDFDPEYPEIVSEIHSDEYYVNMMIAWYFATALAKQYETVIPYIEQKRLDKWTHNKTIQKAVESYRISADKKDYLKTLKIK
jgi:3-methyladenine DNA glycosylase AlkD